MRTLRYRYLSFAFFVVALTVMSSSAALAENMCHGAPIHDGDTVDIRGSDSGWRDCLIGALATRFVTVRLAPDVKMDMTGVQTPINIVQGVTFTSVVSFDQPAPPPRPQPTARTGFDSHVRDVVGGRRRPEAGPAAEVAEPPPTTPRIAEARGPSSLGPLIFTRDKPSELFQVRCFKGGVINDHVRISGFRLEGAEQGRDSSGNSVGIRISSCVDVTISNMEIFGWSNSGIFSGDGDDFPRQRFRNEVHVSDSFFHHNQHIGQFGYGINPKAAVIERNVFDFNRHAISTGGEAIGYDARRNLVLKGGGYHGYAGFAYTHQFDVHGTDSCGTFGSFNCGQAGALFHFFENAFQYNHDHAIGIRGTPREAAYIERNVFVHESIRDPTLSEGAVHMYQGDTRILFGNGIKANFGGVETFGQYGVCDFDGDGKDDLFLPTGVTWWFAGKGQFHWTYLNAMQGTLNLLRVGYFNDDAQCDVLADNGREWLISRSGRTPWEPFGNFGTRLKDVAFGRFDPNVRNQMPNSSRKATHAFRVRDGRWEVTSLTAPNWTQVQGSGKSFADLRFGDFTGDGVTDVLAVNGGRWSISESATSGWRQLNPTLGDEVGPLLIADIDNNNRDDIIRVVRRTSSTSISSAHWEVEWQVSFDGVTPWQTVKTCAFQHLLDKANVAPIFAFTGRFDDAPGADLLTIEPERRGLIVNAHREQTKSHFAY